MSLPSHTTRCTFVLSIRDNDDDKETRAENWHRTETFHEIIYGKSERGAKERRVFFCHIRGTATRFDTSQFPLNQCVDKFLPQKGWKIPGDKHPFAVLCSCGKCPHLCIINQREQREHERRMIDRSFADFHEIIQGKPVSEQKCLGTFFFFWLQVVENQLIVSKLHNKWSNTAGR